MDHSRGDACALEWFCGASGLALVIFLASVCAVGAGTWTWTGLGRDDNWSTAGNWSPAKSPGSDNATTLIFDGCTRLAPEQDLYDSFLFGNLTFATHAGAFHLGGSVVAHAKSAWRSLQFSGTNSSLNVLGGGNVLIQGVLVTPDSSATQTITVASSQQLQVPWIKGGLRRMVVKKGGGLLRVYEPDEGQCYLEKDAAVGPEYRVEDGLVEMGARTNRYVLNSSETGWIAATCEVKASHTLTIGDGAGGATSAIFRLIGPPQTQVIDNNLAIQVNDDGLLDLGGVQNWDTTNTCCLLVSNGLVRTGGSSIFVRNGQLLDLRGSARIEGDGNSAIRFYDGATSVIAGLATCAVIAAHAALISATNAAGVVFQVSGSTGDVAALEVSGHLGAGGAGSHLVKRGPGTMVIQNLTHAVRTNRVEEGTLLLNGVSRCGTPTTGSQWVVSTNATLGGTGIISNAMLVVQGGTLDPGGTAAGILSLASDLVLQTGATLRFDLTPDPATAGSCADQLLLQQGRIGGLSNATLCIDIHDRLRVDGQTFRIISGGGDLTGQSFCAVTVTGCPGRRAEVNVGNGYVDVTIRNRLAGTGVVIR